VALARNVDVYKEVGGSDRAMGKTWHGLESNAQGKLVVSFHSGEELCLRQRTGDRG